VVEAALSFDNPLVASLVDVSYGLGCLDLEKVVEVPSDSFPYTPQDLAWRFDDEGEMVIVDGTPFAIVHPSLKNDLDDLSHPWDVQANDHDDVDYLECSAECRSKRYHEMIRVGDSLEFV
jgi:hypothetical protein